MTQVHPVEIPQRDDGVFEGFFQIFKALDDFHR
jgi:hypothetical protein